VQYDVENKVLFQVGLLQRIKDKQINPDYLFFQDALMDLRNETSNELGLLKSINKLFFKDKYKRNDNKVELEISIDEILKSENQHLELKLAEQPNCDSSKWHKALKDGLYLHFKIYSDSDKYFIKVVLENKCEIEKNKFSVSKEKVNQVSCFQTEIYVECANLLPFRDYKKHLFKTDEDKMLDYLYQNKLAFGIGHNTSCTWYNNESNEIPKWIKSTFLPDYDVKSQSSETDKINSEILSIKKLSTYNSNTREIISNLKQVAEAYRKWIDTENKVALGNEFGIENIEKCEVIYNRINTGIKHLENNANALRSFQLANTAIYLQMFQSQLNFAEKKEGYEVWEQNETIQYTYSEYGTKPFPNNTEPAWRPFQLAFVLQSITSFVEVNCEERELIDLLYFPTGGGKTEAYLAVSAFLIFWRRLEFTENYGGVNIIIRYTLRLLSAQQFERASKLILACEFIRQNFTDLGAERISIGFWVGSSSIPNEIRNTFGTGAETKLDKLNGKFLNGTYNSNRDVNPFQLSNCQWCNTKMISKVKQNDTSFQIGHRISNNKLNSFCPNSKCCFSEEKNGLPIVLVDEDIYNRPPTILFATVDKFAMLAWKGEATNLFNQNRKPDLIIQDELHLLNGTLGSLVGLFENALLELCSTENQKPKIIASTATVKNVDKQILGLYGRKARIFPQYATNSDDTFFSKVIPTSKRKYIGVLPTGKTTVFTNLQLLASLMYARLEIWQQSTNKEDADNFWTILSYFKSLKEIGRFANKINSELKPTVKQLQVRYLNDNYLFANNYQKLSYRNVELTSRIPNEKIKKNLDKLDTQFDGSLEKHKSYDIVLATNMISVGLDVSRLGVMLMNGMPPNTAEYIQASSRVARKNEGVVFTLYDPFNTRDISFFEDFVQFHKTFYKQVEPLSVTPFAENALDKMLFTMILAYFRHTTQYTANNMANALINDDVKKELKANLKKIFAAHKFAEQDLELINEKIDEIITNWRYKIDAQNDLKYYWKDHKKESLITPLQEKINDTDVLVAMQSMRSVEPNSEILIKQY
jgi:superfamily II DNA/RNA helicase